MTLFSQEISQISTNKFITTQCQQRHHWWGTKKTVISVSTSWWNSSDVIKQNQRPHCNRTVMFTDSSFCRRQLICTNQSLLHHRGNVGKWLASHHFFCWFLLWSSLIIWGCVKIDIIFILTWQSQNKANLCAVSMLPLNVSFSTSPN